MIEGGERGASRTALGAAALRVIHQSLDGTPKILDDPITARLFDAKTLEAIRSGAGAAETPESRGMRLRVVLRSRWAEDRLEQAVRRSVGQLVVLGAGLDTFAYRQPEWAQYLRIFEIDHPASQADKRERLAAAGIAIPPNLTFVAIDFERVSLGEGLLAGGVDFSAPTFFSCLGVLVYLSAEAVDAVFALAAGFPAGSEIAFSFGGSGASRSSATAARAAELGEPWLTRLDPEILERKLRSIGFAEISFLGPEEAERVYLRSPRRDALTAPRSSSIGAAIVG